jgi:hypothetical protein
MATTNPGGRSFDRIEMLKLREDLSKAGYLKTGIPGVTIRMLHVPGGETGTVRERRHRDRDHRDKSVDDRGPDRPAPAPAAPVGEKPKPAERDRTLKETPAPSKSPEKAAAATPAAPSTEEKSEKEKKGNCPTQ